MVPGKLGIMRKLPVTIMVVSVVLIIDKISKVLASNYLFLGYPNKIFAGFNLTLVHNYGAAFSLLGDAGGWQRWFFIAMTIIIGIYLVIWLYKLPTKFSLTWLGLSLILAGALGNLGDRIALGYVVDFFDVYYKAWHWPVFNVADSAICVGSGLLLYSICYQDNFK